MRQWTVERSHGAPKRAHGHRLVGFVLLTFEFHREGRLFVGVCRELGVATDGRDVLKLSDRLAEMVEMYLNGLEEAGETERVFRERGLTLYTDDTAQQPSSQAAPAIPLEEALSAPLIAFKKVQADVPELAGMRG